MIPVQDTLPPIVQNHVDVQMPDVKDNHSQTLETTKQLIGKTRSGRTIRQVRDPYFYY